MRLFIAVELPEKVRQVLCQFRSEIPGARWLPANQLHLTLAFLGEVDTRSTALLINVLAQIQSPAFHLRLSCLGCFPNPRRPRVLWIGVQPEPLLNALAAQVRTAVLSCQIAQEDRAFSPHITLARLKIPAARETAVFLDRILPEQISAAVPVIEFVLFESRLNSGGAIHTPLRSFQLLHGPSLTPTL